jgi:hypothetical protein
VIGEGKSHLGIFFEGTEGDGTCLAQVDIPVSWKTDIAMGRLSSKKWLRYSSSIIKAKACMMQNQSIPKLTGVVENAQQPFEDVVRMAQSEYKQALKKVGEFESNLNVLLVILPSAEDLACLCGTRKKDGGSQ